MSHFTRSRTWVSLAVFAACAPAHAEQETLVITSQQSQLPEVATATRTATPAKLVPQTIDSLSAEELTAFGAPSLSEALAGVPGVNANGDTRFDGINIRGFSASNDFYLDGFRDDMQYTRDLGNIERIEVLKGPAAVLYGRGSTGGSSTASAKCHTQVMPRAFLHALAAMITNALPPISMVRSISKYKFASILLKKITAVSAMAWKANALCLLRL